MYQHCAESVGTRHSPSSRDSAYTELPLLRREVKPHLTVYSVKKLEFKVQIQVDESAEEIQESFIVEWGEVGGPFEMVFEG